MKNMIIPVRASSLADLMDCPARFEARHILGKTMPSQPNSHLGTAIHRATAVFDSSYILGEGVTADEAAGALVDSLRDPNTEVDWSESDTTIDKAEEIGIGLHKKYCEIITPHENYTDVEVLCEALDVNFDDLGITLRLTGSTDRVRGFKDADGAISFGISDLKTGKMAVKTDGTVDTSKHLAQLGVYELLTEQATGKPITKPARIVGLQTNSKLRVATADVTSAKDVLLGTQEESGILDNAAKILKHGIFWGNPRSMMCHQRYCVAFNTCKWRK